VQREFGEVYITPHVIHGDYLWAANRDAGVLYKIDLADGSTVAEIPTGPGAHAVFADEGSIWFSGSDDDGRFVKRIDAETHEERRRYDIPVEAYRVAVGFDSLWVTSFLDNAVVRVDLRSGEVVDRFYVGNATDIAIGDEGVWVARHFTGKVSLVDPAAGEMSYVDTGMELSESIALTQDELWVAGGDAGELVAISRTSHEVVARIPGAHYESVVVLGDTLWAAQNADVPSIGEWGRVAEIDTATRELRRNYYFPNIGPAYAVMTPDGRSIWMTTTSPGGTLLISFDTAP
jgi:streptogramin lyase